MCFIIGKPRNVFSISLANIPIEVHARYSETKRFCEEYLTNAPAAFSVSVFRRDLRGERRIHAEQENLRWLARFRGKGSSFERLALCRKAAQQLLSRNVLLFHGAVMAVNGKAYLFAAKSGTGKTTHCRLWLKTVENCHILNGDKPFLLFRDGKVFACGSPWMGKENYGVNEILPLEAVCILERDETNHIEEVTLKDGFETLVNQTHIPEGNGSFAKAVSMVKQFSTVKLYRLGCNMEDDAARVAYHTMVEKEKNEMR